MGYRTKPNQRGSFADESCLMLLQDLNLSVWLYAHPADMRNKFNGLIALAHSKMQLSPSNGDLFVFMNKRRTHAKILYYSSGGYCLSSKRLEQGRFAKLEKRADKMALSWAQLQCLIDGINWQKVTQSKRFRRQ